MMALSELLQIVMRDVLRESFEEWLQSRGLQLAALDDGHHIVLPDELLQAAVEKGRSGQ